MFRKPSEVSGAPKMESKYVSKYSFKNEPKFEDTYKKYLKEAHMIEHKSEETAVISFTSKREKISQQAMISRLKRENFNLSKMNQQFNLYFKNLDSSIDDAELYALFKPFGRITSHRVCT